MPEPETNEFTIDKIPEPVRIEVGTRIRFKCDIIEPATGDHPTFQLAYAGELGTIAAVGSSFAPKDQTICVIDASEKVWPLCHGHEDYAHAGWFSPRERTPEDGMDGYGGCYVQVNAPPV